MAKVGLVTVLYNSADVLEGFFRSLSAQSFKDYHLYLVDNKVSAEIDALIAELILTYPVSGYTHIRNSDNEGVAKGNNQGIKMALEEQSEYVLLLNNDIEFYQENLISTMVEFADNGQYIIVPKILYYESRRIWMAGGKLIKSRGYTIHIGENEIDSPQYSVNGYFDYAPTCFMLINKSVFEAIGTMDEKYFVYFDDTDFIFRAVNAGYKVYYIGNLEVLHKVSNSTGGNETLFSIYHVNRNRIYFIRKNFKHTIKIIAIFYTLISRIFKLGYYNKEQRSRLIAGVKDGIKMSW